MIKVINVIIIVKIALYRISTAKTEKTPQFSERKPCTFFNRMRRLG
jgi:hypothetical protein